MKKCFYSLRDVNEWIKKSDETQCRYPTEDRTLDHGRGGLRDEALRA